MSELIPNIIYRWFFDTPIDFILTLGNLQPQCFPWISTKKKQAMGIYIGAQSTQRTVTRVEHQGVLERFPLHNTKKSQSLHWFFVATWYYTKSGNGWKFSHVISNDASIPPKIQKIQPGGPSKADQEAPPVVSEHEADPAGVPWSSPKIQWPYLPPKQKHRIYIYIYTFYKLYIYPKNPSPFLE